MIYEFKNILEGKEESNITIIAQSPVIHTVAIGFSNGDIALSNLQTDQILFTFKQTEGSIKSLTFSSDTTMTMSLLASVSGEGSSITLWDLNKQKIHTLI